MAYDMNRCPQTEDEFREFFYTLIGRSQGTPATDWEAVMTAEYVWQGQWLMIPEGVGPGVRQPPDAPFWGLTQQYSGGPKGRVFLPTSVPDDLGYYTRCLQYLDDAAGTYSHAKDPKAVQFSSKSGALIWAWYWVAGHDYTPITDNSGTVPPAGDYQTQIDALHDRVEILEEAAIAHEERLTEIESVLHEGLHAHGPINLPVVLEGGPSLRCKGDIDVMVKPGQATPPDMSPDPIDPRKLAVFLHRFLGDES